jgi:SPP1 gp7 family putative phage head morphogenesis protein
MAFKVTADPERFNEAADYFLKLSVLTREEAAQLGAEAGRRAFWIGGGLHLSQVQRVFDRVADAIEQGTPFDEWRKQVKGELRNDAHAETVFRNATQRSLNAGRWRQMHEPGVARFRPYVLFDGIADSRQSEICRECDGTIVPLGSPWLATHSPLLHHRCRSCLRNLRVSEAQRRGITNVLPLVEADEGFGLPPEDEPDWKPDPAKTDPALLRELGKKQGKRPKALPPAETPKEHDPKHWEGVYAEQYDEAAPNVAWGRAMLERGLDRSAGGVVAELERLHKAGHPALTNEDGVLARNLLGAIDPNRPLRSNIHAEWLKGYVALSEHTRSIAVDEFKMLGVRLPAQAQAFWDLTLDKSVKRPFDWRVNRVGGRSYAEGRGRTVNVRIGASHATYVHEIAHAIEFEDARALQRSLAFLKARTKGEKAQRLSDLTGLPYGPLELTRPDKFLEPYIGKDYGSLGTEVTSVGHELLAGGTIGEHTLQSLARHDQEHLLFLLGQLAGR